MWIPGGPQSTLCNLSHNFLDSIKCFLKKHAHGDPEILEIIQELDQHVSEDHYPVDFVTYDISQLDFFKVNAETIQDSKTLEFLETHRGILVFVSTEGEHRGIRYPMVLAETKRQHQLDRDQIHFITGSHYPETAESDHIHTHFVPLLLKTVCDVNEEYLLGNFDRSTALNERYQQGIYYSALSKNRRPWRTQAVYHLLHSRIRSKGKISFLQVGGWNCGNKEIEDYMRDLTLVIEEELRPIDDIYCQYPGESHIFMISPPCYDHVLFHINMETHQDDNGCVFYTEKTGKALWSGVPFVTWGEAGMNTRHFEDLGFAPYSDWFDLSFDTEADPERRWNLLQAEAERVCDELDGMTRSQQIAWSTQNTDLIAHNRQQMINLCVKQFEKFCRSLLDSVQSVR